MSTNENMKYILIIGALGGTAYVFRNSFGGIFNLVGTAANTLDTAVSGVVSLTQNPNAGLTPNTFNLGKSMTSNKALITAGVAGAGSLFLTKNVLTSLVVAGAADGAWVLYDYSTQKKAPESETTSGDVFAPTGVVSNTFNNIGNALSGGQKHQGLDGTQVSTFGSRDDQITFTPNAMGVVDNLNKVSRLGDFMDLAERYSYANKYNPHKHTFYRYIDSKGHINLCADSEATCGADPKSTWMQPKNIWSSKELVDWVNPITHKTTEWDNGIQEYKGKRYHRIDIRCEHQYDSGPYRNKGDPNKNCGVPAFNVYKGKRIIHKVKSDDPNWYKLYLEI